MAASDAVDSALRFVQYRNNVLGRPNKKKVIARQKGYHGSSFLSASVSGKERDRAFMDTYEDMVHFYQTLILTYALRGSALRSGAMPR